MKNTSCVSFHLSLFIKEPDLSDGCSQEENFRVGLEYVCLVAQSCLTLCDPMQYRRLGFSVHQDSPGKNTGVGCHALLQGIFLSQGLNPGLLHCRRILYHLNHQGNPQSGVGWY